MLEVLAGEDGLDPRQYAPKVAPYTRGARPGVKGMKIALVKEGFGLPRARRTSTPRCGRRPTDSRGSAPTSTEISLPEHRGGPRIWTPIASEGAQVQMMLGNGMGFNWKGLYTSRCSTPMRRGGSAPTSCRTR